MSKLSIDFSFINRYFVPKSYTRHAEYRRGRALNNKEAGKSPKHTDIINYLVSKKDDPNYLEIGVNDPRYNFNLINASQKHSVDPGVEFKQNPVDFQLTSDEFFAKLSKGEILNPEIRFDLIFIDGLHLAHQADRDIANALKFIQDDGFIVIHDCNPATEWHAREFFQYNFTPAGKAWNGTTWKAFMKWRYDSSVFSCCIDSDWGVGIISKSIPIGKSIENTNPFYEFRVFEENRKEYLNLVTFEEFEHLVDLQ